MASHAQGGALLCTHTNKFSSSPSIPSSSASILHAQQQIPLTSSARVPRLTFAAKTVPSETPSDVLRCRQRLSGTTSSVLICCSSRRKASTATAPEEDGSDDLRRRVVQALLWGAEAVYILWLFLLPYAPGDPVWAISSETVNSLIGLSLNFFFILPLMNSVGIRLIDAPVLHPMSEGLFNFVIGWTLMFAPLLFTDLRRDRYKGSLDVLWGLQMFLTNTFLIPYMAIRLNEVDENDSKPSKPSQLGLVMTGGGPVVGLLGGGICLISTLWALLARADGDFGNITEREEQGSTSHLTMGNPPQTMRRIEAVEGRWTTGLWDCREDGSNCLLTCFCPCITFGRIAEIVDRGTTPSEVASLLYSGQGCRWLYGSLYRSKLRRLFSLPEAPYSDSVLHSCCCVCALSQEHRELVNRGIDPSIGWEANVEKWKCDGLTPPIVADGMSR